MIRVTTWRARPARTGALTLLVGAALVLGLSGAPVQAEAEPTEYVGSVEVIPGPARPSIGDGRRPPDRDSVRRGNRGTVARGVVFSDTNRDARSQENEDGIAGVLVSNGREVVRTDEEGRYELPAYENMTLFVTKPAGYDVPVSENNFPQFFYHHLPEGSPPLRFGGLPPSGPLPRAVNFPMAPSGNASDENSCAIIGDSQTYSNREIGYLRDGVVEDLAGRDNLDQCGALMLGDLMGDDLGLFPRFKEVMSQADIPIRGVPGNHDLDFDAGTDEHSFDTYRREIGPSYYSFDVGDVHFVGLDNVRYPCTPEEDNADGKHAYCNDPADHPTYNGVIDDEQMAWLANDLAHVPTDKLVVIATHIPLVSFIDMNSTKHQTDNANELYELLKGRPALSLSGHTHTLENLRPGEHYAGWQEAVGVGPLPFPHVVAGAASGSWWGGDLDADGIPMAFGREGVPGGYAIFDFDGTTYRNTYDVTPFGDEQQIALSLNSPHFRQWAETLRTWRETSDDDDTPPVNINDLGDPDLVVTDELAETWLVANVWNGSKDTQVSVQIDGGETVMATRTQPGEGEGMLEGLEYADPFAMTRQLQVARHAFRSTSGDPRAQGYERFRGSRSGPADPRPEDEGTDQSSHLWRLPLPRDLAEGAHTATVRTTDPNGGEHVETLVFEVREERPPSFFRTEVFQE